ncbi:primosomal protein N' [candidate division KSB1 bacterium]|nr:primosomal protein N' [candidate division KSB1 bacterium]
MPETYVNVALPLPLNKTFTYLVPLELTSLAKIGSRVIAPFGARRLTGFIVGITNKTELEQVKTVQDILDLKPLISSEMLKLAGWISDYYLCSLGEVLKSMVPGFFMKASKSMVEICTKEAETEAAKLEKRAPRRAQTLRYIAKSRKISVNELRRRIGAKSIYSSLNQLESIGLVKVQQFMTNFKLKPKVEKYVSLLSENFDEVKIEILQRRAPKQASCLRYLQVKKQEVLQKELLKQTGSALASLKALEKSNLIRFIQKEVVRDYYGSNNAEKPKPISPNDEQKAALKQIEVPIREERFETFLLFGVTGSGKTQVYIEAIYKTLEKGKDAIVLVPEIALTPQTVARFRSHFKDKVAVLHSAMSSGERLDSWRLLKKGEAKVAIGPRSAVFAPLKNIGLIVVDEEHEGSYKQDTSPRYHARDVAVVRAKFADAVVILGSATPSAESFFNAKTEKYKLIELRRRVNDVPLPDVKILDMRKERRLSGKKDETIFSRLLSAKIQEKITRKEQIILLLNRRGFSNYIKCRDCGHVEECGDCQITLTFHLTGHRLRCHYCGFSKPAPDKCAECRGIDILFRGLGTQRVEEELKNQFPKARVVRMDIDTTSGKWSHDKILKEFGQGKYDILLGTQMVAKGLDFHKVTLVGVINADVGMLIPDFRSSERTFQLLTQVAGRAGRSDLLGEVIIQSYFPHNFCLNCALTHDFIRFYRGEVLERRELMYPPFGRIICLLFSGENELKVKGAAQEFEKALKKQRGYFQILGATASPISKIKKRFRWQILLKGDKEKDANGKILKKAIQNAHGIFKSENKSRGVRIAIDVDPVSII